MTRRDYCAVCKEMVADCDPRCDGCDESFCYSCPSINDNISRLTIIKCKMDAWRSAALTIDELNSIVNISTDEVMTYCKTELYRNYNDYRNDKVPVMLNKLKNNFEKVKKNLIISENNKDNNKHNIKLLKDFFSLSNDYAYIEYTFTCLMCHKGIKIQY